MANSARTLRHYQRRIFQESLGCNALVVLPTGSGKTRIAAEHITSVCEKRSFTDAQRKVLFLVPTCLLVDQQAQGLRSDTGLQVTTYYGGSGPPQTSAQVLVATPAAFLSLANKDAANFSLGCFALVVFDEVHHVIKRHPYRKVARQLQRMLAANVQSMQGHVPQVIGLSASLTYSMGDGKIKNAIEQLRAELHITKVLTASVEELHEGGYHASEVPAQLYTQHQDPSPADTAAGSNIDMEQVMSAAKTEPQPLPGRVHEALPDFLSAIKCNSSDLHPLSPALMHAVRATEAAAAAHDPTFFSPVGQPGKRGKVAAWGQYAYDKHKHVLKQTQSNSSAVASNAAASASVYLRLHHLYEALRLTVSSRQASLELAMRYLEMTGLLSPVSEDEGLAEVMDSRDGDTEEELVYGRSGLGGLRFGTTDSGNTAAAATAADRLASSAVAELEEMWHSYSPILLRLRRLSAVLLQQSARYADRLRVIVFVQQRVSTHVLQHYISHCAGLSDLASDVVYATTSPATPTLSVSASESLQRIAHFSAGQLQLLFATAVAEEGMDIAQANCVVRFDAIQTPVSLVQSRGRARQEDSSFVVMCEQQGRGVAQLVQAEGQQRAVLQAMAAEHENKKHAATSSEMARKKVCAQASRNLSGRNAVTAAMQAGKLSSASMVQLFAQKAGGEVEEVYVPPKNAATGSIWQCTMRYLPHPDAAVRGGEATVSAHGAAHSKKEAKEAAAAVLLRDSILTTK